MIFNTPEDQSVAKQTLDVIDAMGRELQGGVADLQKPEVRKEIEKRVEALQETVQGQLDLSLIHI